MMEKIRQYDIYRRCSPTTASQRTAPSTRSRSQTAVKECPGEPRPDAPVDRCRLLLTGFDAPSATYLYIGKKMRDHGLFQAICRVNRLDGDDKDYGYIIDYQDLFNSLEAAVTDYTSGALDGYERQDIEGLLADRIDKAREDLDEALERIRALVEPVAPPKWGLQYQRYFCAAEYGTEQPRPI